MEIYYERVKVSKGVVNEINYHYIEKKKEIIENIKRELKVKYSIEIDIKNNSIVKTKGDAEK
tara:strand:+ start:1518 stop:1703 length:186 start_codon:yes stop_codon:yes gene_type:complete